jgi:hypothetical protein
MSRHSSSCRSMTRQRRKMNRREVNGIPNALSSSGVISSDGGLFQNSFLGLATGISIPQSVCLGAVTHLFLLNACPAVPRGLSCFSRGPRGQQPRPPSPDSAGTVPSPAASLIDFPATVTLAYSTGTGSAALPRTIAPIACLVRSSNPNSLNEGTLLGSYPAAGPQVGRTQQCASDPVTLREANIPLAFAPAKSIASRLHPESAADEWSASPNDSRNS